MQHEITVPFRDGFTWARVTEPAEPAGTAPLFVLHGGPGMAHNYVANLDALADLTGRTVVHYDQIGCGKSSHHPDAPASQWVPQLFVDEFHESDDVECASAGEFCCDRLTGEHALLALRDGHCGGSGCDRGAAALRAKPPA